MTKPFAKALTKHVYQFGAPFTVIAPGFVPGILIWVITGWLWYFVPLGLVWFVFVKLKYEKDEYWLSYFFDALREKTHMEP